MKRRHAIIFLIQLLLCSVSVNTPTLVFAQQAKIPVAGPADAQASGSAYERYQESYWIDFAIPYQKLQVEKETENVDLLREQSSYGKAIFITVVIIVISGLALSVLQFLKTVWLVKNISHSSPADSSTIKASLQGFEITSASIGLIILVVSLAFFYLYLKFVYTITTLNVSAG